MYKYYPTYLPDRSNKTHKKSVRQLCLGWDSNLEPPIHTLYITTSTNTFSFSYACFTIFILELIVKKVESRNCIVERRNEIKQKTATCTLFSGNITINGKCKVALILHSWFTLGVQLHILKQAEHQTPFSAVLYWSHSTFEMSSIPTW